MCPVSTVCFSLAASQQHHEVHIPPCRGLAHELLTLAGQSLFVPVGRLLLAVLLPSLSSSTPSRQFHAPPFVPPLRRLPCARAVQSVHQLHPLRRVAAGRSKGSVELHSCAPSRISPAHVTCMALTPRRCVYAVRWVWECDGQLDPTAPPLTVVRHAHWSRRHRH